MPAIIGEIESCLASGRAPLRGWIDRASSERERAVRIVEWVDSTLERRMWSAGEIENRICARSPREILRDGHICYATPCFDLASVVSEVLRACGHEVDFVLCRMKRFLQRVALQSGVEVVLDGIPHFIGFGRTSKRLQPGRYQVVGPRKAVHRRDVEGEMFERCYLGLFGIGSYYEIPRILDGYRPQSEVARFQRMMRPGPFRRAMRKSIRSAKSAAPGQVASPGRWPAPA